MLVCFYILIYVRMHMLEYITLFCNFLLKCWSKLWIWCNFNSQQVCLISFFLLCSVLRDWYCFLYKIFTDLIKETIAWLHLSLKVEFQRQGYCEGAGTPGTDYNKYTYAFPIITPRSIFLEKKYFLNNVMSEISGMVTRHLSLFNFKLRCWHKNKIIAGLSVGFREILV